MDTWDIFEIVAYACAVVFGVGTLIVFSARSRKFKAIAAGRNFSYSKEGASELGDLGENFEVFAGRQAVLATAVNVIAGEIEDFRFSYFEVAEANSEIELKTSLLIVESEIDPLPDLWLGMGREREEHERAASTSGTVSMQAIEQLREGTTKCSIECRSGKLLMFRFGRLIKPAEFDTFLRHGLQTWQFLIENTRRIQL